MAKFISDRNARLLGGATGVGIAINKMLAGGAIAIPALTVDNVIDIYAPGILGAAALLPGINLPNEKRLLGVSLAVVGGRNVLLRQRTAINFDNILEGYAPLILGVVLFL